MFSASSHGWSIRRLRGFVWRGLVLAVVFGCGLGAFLLGATTSERPHISGADILAHIYYTLGLFVLGGMDLGVPDGGPAAARALLWFAYFAAPAVTAASLIDGVLRAIAPARWRMRRMRGYVVIAGMSRISLLYLKRLRALRPNVPVLVIEQRPDHPATVAAREVYRVQLIAGDIRSDAVLDVLRLERASRVMLLTGDDFANLDAAAKIMHRSPGLASRTVVHVSDLRFMHVLSGTGVAKRCEVFNRYQVAAAHLVKTEILAHFHRTEPRDVVVLAGFGRFGQTVLDELQRRAPDKFDRVVIMDLDAERRAAVFHQQVGFAGFYRREVIDGDLRDPRVWDRIGGLATVEPVFILGSGDDGTNLRSALWLKSRFPNAYVVARSFARSSFADDISREGGFVTFSVADLVIRSFPDAWFGRP